MKDSDKWQFYDHFRPFFCHMHVHVLQNWDSDGHFEVLNGSNFWLTQDVNISISMLTYIFLCFCTLCHNFGISQDLDLLSTSKWLSDSEPQFWEKWTYIQQKNVQKISVIYQYFSFRIRVYHCLLACVAFPCLLPN